MKAKFTFGPFQELYEAARFVVGPPTHTYMSAMQALSKAVADVEKAYAETQDLAGFVQQARESYASDECEIDDDPMVSPSDEGCFVSAWVWVAKEEIEE